jgi:hypothetical protein
MIQHDSCLSVSEHCLRLSKSSWFDDLYGHDADLEKVLAKGYPFPK